jgi:hypothetical protein
MTPRLPVVIAVEGTSDKTVLELLARRIGLDAPTIAPIGGAHAIRRFVAGLGSETAVRGLCDEREAHLFRRVLDDVCVCVPDLEGELIRALGVARVEAIVDVESFRRFQQQPAQRGRPVDAQLHRWLRSSHVRYARHLPLLVEALELDRIPAPLLGVLS